MTASKIVELANRCKVQIFTTKRFRRPDNPQKCSKAGYYHVWRWRGGPSMPLGLRCKCGLLSN